MQNFATKLEQLINKYFEDTTDTQTRDDFLIELLETLELLQGEHTNVLTLENLWVLKQPLPIPYEKDKSYSVHFDLETLFRPLDAGLLTI